jgi:hypothetical protein
MAAGTAREIAAIDGELMVKLALYRENYGARIERRLAIYERFLSARLERHRLGLPPLAIRHDARSRPPK